MSLNGSQLLFSGDEGITDSYKINNSLRFRSSNISNLSRTFATPTSTSTWTFSAWIKIGNIAPTNASTLIASRPSGTTTAIYFNPTGNLVFWNNEAVAATSTAIFRDPSAWYHVVVSSNGTTTTAYVNNQTVLTWAGDLSLINNAGTHYIGHAATTGARDFDGYFSETYFVDGQSLTPSSFGASHPVTGVWRPKAYTGAYGTNGFYLKFSDIALTSGSNAGLGKDFSGNTNYWDTNNISLTAGTTYDAMIDVPTLTSKTVANYCVLNPIGSVKTLSNLSQGNLLSSSTSSTTAEGAVGTIAMDSGKWYWEVTVTTTPYQKYPYIGIIADSIWVTNSAGNVVNSNISYNADGNTTILGTVSAYGASFTTNDIIGVALDLTAGTLTFYKNNVSQGTALTGINTNNAGFLPYLSVFNTGATGAAAINFGQQPFVYTPPTGHLALNTFNLSAPTIPTGNEYMDATLYTGNGSAQTITNAGSFKPDFLWIKGRSGATEHQLLDSVRGALGVLASDSSTAETVYGSAQVAFNTNGFTVGGLGTMNNASATYVGWQWQAGQGTTSSNTAGSITSTVSVNATAGFSIVTYTGTGANATVGHGLGVAPKFIILKSRSGALNWATYHESLGNTKYVIFNSDATAATAPTVWNNTSPTSTLFSLGSGTTTNTNGGNYVAYCWAEIEGFSKFSSHTGNSSANGLFIYTGFRPKYLIIRRYDNSPSEWIIIDSSRNTYNVNVNILEAENANAETVTTVFTGTAGQPAADFLSNGFKIRSAGNHVNSSNNFITIAFAENPFKYSNAR
jgi:hypothetical protein